MEFKWVGKGHGEVWEIGAGVDDPESGQKWSVAIGDQI